MLTPSRIGAGVLTVAAVAGLVVGWWVFWFQCDDAFIAFRYASNSALGYGYVWNPPPYAPVEGFTSFLWVVLLDAVWAWTGFPPPTAANVLSLGFSLGSLAVVGAMLVRLHLSAELQRWRVGFAAVAVAGILTNRAFLAFTSSGLETAMFTFFVLVWAFLALGVRRSAWLPGALTLAAAGIALTRPDGLLFVAASVIAVVLWTVRASGSRRIASAAGLVPVAIPIAHLVWRHATYGDWLPNTFYAKTTGVYPHIGLAYLGSFFLEYALWVPGAVAVAVAVRGWQRWSIDRLVRVGLASALVLHAGYYTLIVGGDHFEYRVYHHWIPLIFVALPWMLSRLELRRDQAMTLAIGAVLLSWPIPWTHWAMSQGRTTRKQTQMMYQPVTAFVPLRIWPGAWAFDGLQHVVITRNVGMRHQEHKVFGTSYAERYPTREEGAKITGDLPSHEAWAVGIPGWTLPHVAILDGRGLNDRVVARNPVATDARMAMAHERQPPEGYFECLRPNVRVRDGVVKVRKRHPPLTEDEVRRCEARFWAVVSR